MALNQYNNYTDNLMYHMHQKTTIDTQLWPYTFGSNQKRETNFFRFSILTLSMQLGDRLRYHCRFSRARTAEAFLEILWQI